MENKLIINMKNSEINSILPNQLHHIMMLYDVFNLPIKKYSYLISELLSIKNELLFELDEEIGINLN